MIWSVKHVQAICPLLPKPPGRSGDNYCHFHASSIIERLADIIVNNSINLLINNVIGDEMWKYWITITTTNPLMIETFDIKWDNKFLGCIKYPAVLMIRFTFVFKEEVVQFYTYYTPSFLWQIYTWGLLYSQTGCISTLSNAFYWYYLKKRKVWPDILYKWFVFYIWPSFVIV